MLPKSPGSRRQKADHPRWWYSYLKTDVQFSCQRPCVWGAVSYVHDVLMIPITAPKEKDVSHTPFGRGGKESIRTYFTIKTMSLSKSTPLLRGSLIEWTISGPTSPSMARDCACACACKGNRERGYVWEFIDSHMCIRKGCSLRGTLDIPVFVDMKTKCLMRRTWRRFKEMRYLGSINVQKVPNCLSTVNR